MDTIRKLEHQVLAWFKNIAHLPRGFREGLAANLWWIILVVAILSTIGILFESLWLTGVTASIGAVAGAYSQIGVLSAWGLIVATVGLFFAVLQTILMFIAVQPLKERQKKGWVLLFGVLLVSAMATVVGALLTLNPFIFIANIIFGALWLGVFGYFLFEIHGQFGHVEKSKGVKTNK